MSEICDVSWQSQQCHWYWVEDERVMGYEGPVQLQGKLPLLTINLLSDEHIIDH